MRIYGTRTFFNSAVAGEHGMKIVFITNMCSHFVRPLFEILARRYEVKFYFTGGHEAYWYKRNELKSGDFKGTYLGGLLLSGNFKVTPGLFALPWLQCGAVVKTIDDRFALPVAFCAAKLFGKPFILWTGLWAHPQTPLHRRTFGLTKFIYRHADAIITYGEHVRRYLTDIGIDERKIFCAPHATDNTVYDRPVGEAEKIQLKQRWKITVDSKVILFVGRLEEGKGLEYLAEAMGRLKDKAAFVLVGTGSKETGLRDLCTQKGVCAVFVGHVDNEELYFYYAMADIFVLPSVTTSDFKEPWGMVINEAMNQGCAVVTTDAVGAAAGGLVEEGKTGFIVAEKNSARLAEALEHLLKDETMRRRMGQAGRAKIAAWTPQQQAEGFARAFAYVENDH